MQKAIKKYYWKIIIGLLPVIIFLPLAESLELTNYLRAMLFVMVFPAVVATLLAFLETKVFHRYYSELNYRAASLFDAKIEAPDISFAQLGKYDIYIRINKERNSPIEFHIPKNQIDKMKHKPKFRYRDASIGNMNTYLVMTSTSLFLKRTKKLLERKIAVVSKYR